MENRLEKGAQAQADIFGAHMKEVWKAGHINRWLAANCFGDYYTRTGLDLRQREMITPHPGRFPVPALHRVSEKPECHYMHQ